MAGFTIRRDANGRFSFRAQGCCGDSDRMRLEYERAFMEQVLREGGAIESTDDDQVTIIDRKGRRHVVPAAACASSPIGAA